ncbi:hypothetical protein Glove_114g136 [Diversispora epigaea]|uniref:Uncharacterized protein n=1 Tax=Diversispora epigaea TaxID=1348612 RepID=A0A397J7Y7_9GLOM|nr:hypothetical protein Glove_114g136 [Diversispora epigaea]
MATYEIQFGFVQRSTWDTVNFEVCRHKFADLFGYGYKTTLYGITKDPKTHKYMMALYYYRGGSLRNNLINNFDNYDIRNRSSIATIFLEPNPTDLSIKKVLPGGEFAGTAIHVINEGLEFYFLEE